ncbi:MAG: type II toxin-antitoxin system VapC family toxin [Chloroflexota bacterium]|nr:type II toxin-antitoxin system VapC family toxin [Chloroflexota bacterium]
MSSPIFVDANIPIYAAGAPHPLKAPCIEILRLIGSQPEAFITDAEVLEELLHRYLRARLWPDPGSLVLHSFDLLMRGRIETIRAEDVMDAAGFATGLPDIPARDLLHFAVMTRLGASRVVTADKDFAKLLSVTRLDPADLSTWRSQVGR